MALKQIKNKIISTKKTGKVTKAMESVSAVKMRKSQERAFLGRPYVEAAVKILERLAHSREGAQHPLVAPRAEGRTLLVVVTSDKGLAGSVNSAVLKRAEQFLAQTKEVDALTIGRKAGEFAKRQKLALLGEYTNVSDGVTMADVSVMTDTILNAYQSGTYARVTAIYQNFISTFEQTPVARQVLPLSQPELYELMAGITLKGAGATEKPQPTSTNIPYSIEPSTEEVLSVLIPQLVAVLLYHALLESKASEHSARMVAMKNATDKSKDMIKSLTIVYNKQRQASITAEVSEITAGVEAMK